MDLTKAAMHTLCINNAELPTDANTRPHTWRIDLSLKLLCWNSHWTYNSAETDMASCDHASFSTCLYINSLKIQLKLFFPRLILEQNKQFI